MKYPFVELGGGTWFLFPLSFAATFRLILYFHWRQDCLAWKARHPELGCAFGNGKLDVQTAIVSLTPLVLAAFFMMLPAASHVRILVMGALAAGISATIYAAAKSFDIVFLQSYIIPPLVASLVVAYLHVALRQLIVKVQT
ncbi:MAG: hypothetical protein ACJ8R9_13225 [Steroidobacteraceae bacterium]